MFNNSFFFHGAMLLTHFAFSSILSCQMVVHQNSTFLLYTCKGMACAKRCYLKNRSITSL